MAAAACSSGGAPGGGGTAAGGAGGGTTTGTAGTGGPCTISSSHRDPQCEANCANGSADSYAACLSLCPDVTTSTPGVICGVNCVDTTKDWNNCGVCGHVCPSVCSSGTCKESCTNTQASKAPLVDACTKLCAQLGPTCPYASFFSFYPDDSRRPVTAPPTRPWPGAETCLNDCVAAFTYTGPCVDEIASAVNCWQVDCSMNPAGIAGHPPYKYNSTTDFVNVDLASDTGACRIENAAAETCVNDSCVAP